ncbi:MAG: MoaD/ThiS family protein [Burkholderiaceae bacterium]|jgi:molybdopterin converting factor small subunit|nr:MoaD/ThiS family protein [Burkholderiaceae bacterium]
MVKVVLYSGSTAIALTGGQTEFEVEADNFRRLILELERRFPGLGQHVEAHMAVAVDGEIFQDAYGLALHPGSEIGLIPKIAGG